MWSTLECKLPRIALFQSIIRVVLSVQRSVFISKVMMRMFQRLYLFIVIMSDLMEIPVHDVVNTGTELFREGAKGREGFINVCLTREAANQPWGFRLQGGKDRGLPFQLLKVITKLKGMDHHCIC